MPMMAPASGGRPRGSRVTAICRSVRAFSCRSAASSMVWSSSSPVQRPDRAKRLAAPPRREIEILQMRAAAVKYPPPGVGTDAEQRIGRGKGAGAGAYHELGGQAEAGCRRLVKPALPVTAVTAAREHYRIEHSALLCIPGDQQTAPACQTAGQQSTGGPMWFPAVYSLRRHGNSAAGKSAAERFSQCGRGGSGRGLGSGAITSR